MFRFSIRDVLWLTVMAGLTTGWGVDAYRLRHALATTHEQRIVVFRHNPGIIDTEESMVARNADERAILKVAQTARGGCTYQGGLGSGYELSIHVGDLGRWKTAVDKLIEDGALKYYDVWALDRFGFGLVPLR
jgi:hypothetical protein